MKDNAICELKLLLDKLESNTIQVVNITKGVNITSLGEVDGWQVNKPNENIICITFSHLN